ncbi:MAG: hypothetical protein VX346_06845 [Planctomycetota bacterium]|nr:hypothetical protein [Planctomycetota bacterium]
MPSGRVKSRTDGLPTESTGMIDRRPDFMVIGAMKSGTSSTHYFLSQHTQIAISASKELDFLVKELNWFRQREWYAADQVLTIPAAYLRLRRIETLQRVFDFPGVDVSFETLQFQKIRSELVSKSHRRRPMRVMDRILGDRLVQPLQQSTKDSHTCWRYFLDQIDRPDVESEFRDELYVGRKIPCNGRSVGCRCI